jgi:hypothetical protein
VFLQKSSVWFQEFVELAGGSEAPQRFDEASDKARSLRAAPEGDGLEIRVVGISKL